MSAKSVGQRSRWGAVPRRMVAAALLVFLAAGPGSAAKETLTVVDFSTMEDVEAGEAFARKAAAEGWLSPLGDPRYFHISNGRLHLVSKPGPVYEKRYTMALFDRERLIDSIENKVLLRLTGTQFRLDPQRWNRLCFTMAPIALPAEEADLRRSDKNDAAFYLIVSFDTKRFTLGGYKIPRSIGYVWANRQWREEIGKDPDYDDFLRYIAIGWGRDQGRRLHRVCRPLAEDFRRAYPDYDEVPEVIELSLKIDSNTLGGTAESMVGKIWLEKETGGDLVKTPTGQK